MDTYSDYFLNSDIFTGFSEKIDVASYNVVWGLEILDEKVIYLVDLLGQLLSQNNFLQILTPISI